MAVGVFIGKFQPFHNKHLDTILKLYQNTNLVLIIPIYLEKDKKEILTPKNPIPINYRYNYIKSVLEEYIDSEKYYVIPLNILDKNFITKFMNILKSTGEKEFLIYTRDLNRFFIYKVFSLISKLYSLSFKVYYDKNKKFCSEDIRKAIIDGYYEKIKCFLPKELDKKSIMYIKYYKICKNQDLDNFLRYIISLIV
ncbi:MAG: hypothetical protein QXM04_01135 [Nanopusillaceae archaeon]